MNKELRHFVVAFVIALALYAVAFYWIEHRRRVKGPWDVGFYADASGSKLVINQHTLGITNVEVRFEGAFTNQTSEVIRFDKARAVPFSVPFGECIFLDGTFLPGTVTLRCFGIEIEMIPRVLIVNHAAHSWTNRVVSTMPQSSR